MRLPTFVRVRLLGFARRIMGARPPDRVICGRYMPDGGKISGSALSH